MLTVKRANGISGVEKLNDKIGTDTPGGSGNEDCFHVLVCWLLESFQTKELLKILEMECSLQGDNSDVFCGRIIKFIVLHNRFDVQFRN